MSEPQLPARVAPSWVPPAFLLMALALAPWIVFLFYSLPSREVANHWALAWGGFDVGLAAGLAATGLLLRRRHPATEIAATITGTMLVSDAWFDTLTSRGSATTAIAIAEAVLIELPLAGICFWIARNVEHLFAHPRRFLFESRARRPG